jgi:osmoprotectant transport system ATP-binding protein
MLMDEPFGAIDPITRDRLQNEFLRLHREIRKTVIFVTHDIDEAIKMGDRIAILRQGGVLAQYATPDEILAEPADDFVASFVGADRGLKRLSLTRLADIELEPPRADATADGALTAPAGTSLRDALSVMLTNSGRALVVLGDDGRAVGTVTVDLVSATLSSGGGRRPAAPRP